MKVVILAGGFGTRISEYTRFIPKPMIKIKRLPILVHIMKHYSKFGFNDFYIALGYKGNVIKNYFKNNKFNWKINLVDTGKNTMTGGRLKKLSKIIFITGKGLHSRNGSPVVKPILKNYLSTLGTVERVYEARRDRGGEGALEVILKT
jgi:NDP-sugar pyrophosphorylase family protein